MRTFGILIGLFVLGSPAFAAETITLAPGHQHVISAPGVRRAAIGNPAVADVKAIPESEQVIVTGQRLGNTDLILWLKDGAKKNYSIRVSTSGRNVEAEVRQFLGGIEGLEIRKSGGKLVLAGDLFRGDDLERVQRATKTYPNVVNLTKVNSDALEYFRAEVERRLRENGISGVQVRAITDALFLEGDVRGDADYELAIRLARSIFSNVINHIQKGVVQEPLILVDVRMMEVRRNAIRQFGVRWPGSIGANGSFSVTGAGGGGMLSIGQGAVVTLDALVEKGAARVLSNPKLLCRSGTPATFLAGGEIPIRLVGERTASVMFKSYGVSLQVLAKADRTKQVLLEIETKVSDLDSATSVDNMPGILENRVKTAANLYLGETIVLAGLIENRSRKNVQKVPFLGHIPILGELFKSRLFQENETEFLVFLTPISANPQEKPHLAERTEMQNQMNRAGKELKLSILD